MREEDEADDKATVEAVRTEATRAREPFMFSLWVFSINLRDLIEEEIFKLLTGEIRRGVLTRSRPAVEFIAMMVQSVFYLEIHQNKKKLFLISAYQNNLKT
jgi:hypothetical protein